MTAHRRLITKSVTLAVLSLSAFVVGDTPGIARPCQSNVQYWYSDPACTNHVGTRWINCAVPYVTQSGTFPSGAKYRGYWGDCCGNCDTCTTGTFGTCP